MNTVVNDERIESAAQRGMSLPMIVLTIVSVTSLGLASWACRDVRELKVELSRRPPMAVIQRTNLLRQAMETNAPDAVQREGMTIKAAQKKLRDQGYIVLDGDHVLAWPQQYEARPRAVEPDDGAGGGESP